MIPSVPIGVNRTFFIKNIRFILKRNDYSLTLIVRQGGALSLYIILKKLYLCAQKIHYPPASIITL